MSESKRTYTKFQRVLAMIGVIALIALSVCALIFAVIDFPGSARLSWACLVAAIFMPILIWIWIWLYGQVTRKKTIASVWPDRIDETPEEVSTQDKNSTDSES